MQEKRQVCSVQKMIFSFFLGLHNLVFSLEEVQQSAFVRDNAHNIFISNIKQSLNNLIKLI